MRVLVTGAGGFLGAHLVARLLARGDAVVGLDPDLGPDWPVGAEGVRGTILDPAVLAQAVAGCDAVIHAAALTGLWARDAADFERVNVEGTRAVLAAAAQAGVGRAVHVSSFVTLISGPRRRSLVRLDEATDLAVSEMLGPYPSSKRAAELVALEAEVPAVIVQPSAPVGPGDRGPTPPGRLLQDLANGAVPAMPDCSWNLVDVRALADGVVAALDRGEPRQRYLLSGENMDTTGLLAVFEQVSGLAGPRARVPHGVALIAARVSEAVARGTGRPPQAPLTGVRLSGPRVCFDNAKARAGLGFVPGPIAPAIRDALVWMRSAGRLTRTLPGLPPE